ncbi:MAG: glycosyltransferase family 4 protein [Planctomycetes bacterium]|nr:glycosyltransferase family 4 protein [Planctomycetota bacterium]
MRIAYLVAGAGGMYCGSCMRDNRLAAALIRRGRDVLLLPLYTPIRTDEEDVSLPRVHYGGINVFLQQKAAFFRRTPWVIDRWLDAPGLLRGVGRFAARTRAEDVADLTVSVLEGPQGRQAKELDKLLTVLRELRPTLVHLPMLLLLGVAGTLRQGLGVPIVCSLSGEDIFIDALPERVRARCVELIRTQAHQVDAFIAPTRYYAEYCVGRFALEPSRVHHAPMGIRVEDFDGAPMPRRGPFVIGYLARVCPEKGADVLVEAFCRLHGQGRDCRLRVGGYLGGAETKWWQGVRDSVARRGLTGAFDWVGEVDRAGKQALLRSIHVFSVPTRYVEAKGFPVLEALAAGVPVVQPRRGSFPELVDATGGGVLYAHNDTDALVDALAKLMDDEPLRTQLGMQGRDAVRRLHTDELMAEATWALYERVVGGAG